MGYYANPYRKRISEYEKVLLYAQPNPDWIPGGLGLGGWTGKFAGGRGPWENYFTEARCSDWFAFRDPGCRWEQPYVKEKAEEWRDTHAVHGLLRLRAPPRRDRPRVGQRDDHPLPRRRSSTTSTACSWPTPRWCATRSPTCCGWRSAPAALDHLDTAQMIQAEQMFLAQIRDDVVEDIAPAKETWLEDPVLQGARTVVERLWGESYDPVETLFGMYMVYEPLFGRFARRELFYHHAGLHGDYVTPRTMWSTLRAGDAAARWNFDLFERVLAGDPTLRRLQREGHAHVGRDVGPAHACRHGRPHSVVGEHRTSPGRLRRPGGGRSQRVAEEWLRGLRPGVRLGCVRVDDLVAEVLRVSLTPAEALKQKMWNDDGVKETRRVVVVLARCDEIEVVVEWLAEQYGRRPEFMIEDRGPYYRIDCEEGLEVDLDEIEPLIGHPYNVFDFLVSVSTTIGRSMTVGNKFVLTTSLLGLEEDVPRG